VNCETDFVAKTDQFQEFIQLLSKIILDNFKSSAAEPKVELCVEEILKLQSSSPDKCETINDAIILAAGKLRENIQIRRAFMLTVPPPAAADLPAEYFIGTYVHPSGLTQYPSSKSSPQQVHPMGLYAAATLIKVKDGAKLTKSKQKSLGRDLSQHIVGMNPSKVGKYPKLQRVKAEKYALEDSPEPCSDGKIERRLPTDGSTQLVKQPFLLNSEISMAEWFTTNEIGVQDFVRFRVGEKLPEVAAAAEKKE